MRGRERRNIKKYIHIYPTPCKRRRRERGRGPAGYIVVVLVLDVVFVGRPQRPCPPFVITVVIVGAVVVIRFVSPLAVAVFVSN